MRLFLRISIVMGLGLAVGLWYVGCAKKDENVVRVSSWGDPQENAILQDLIQKFQKEHPAIKVKLERVPFEEYAEKLMTMFQANLAPDVIFVSSENVADFYPKHMLEPLTSYIKADPSVDLKNFYPTLVKQY